MNFDETNIYGVENSKTNRPVYPGDSLESPKVRLNKSSIMLLFVPLMNL